MRSHEIKTRIRYAETDQMGVVYHGNYVQFIEMGRTEWLRALGISYREMEEMGVMLPVISIQINYKKSAFYDEVLTVQTTLKKLPSVKIEFDYVILNESKEIITEANTVLAFINMETKRPMKCPDYILEKLAEIDF
ncbi:acyl-CoA thioester hydrolase [Kordia periserrulae]|uniref:Acyl-CoA thioester hydrolase n=1 Tax=Kordia periserrulae TaxID=701523 RepID=A0A2T6C070_9FLAO|nr:thioesterase family protein [Kordia periserrulae]PTX61714.1 acyl-CoA thioester hydrolase [Kordia periserrulae]